MAITRWEPFAIDLPDRWRRFFEPDPEHGFIRVEERHENGTLVVRAELPGVNPDEDIDVSVSDGVLHIGAVRSEHKDEKDNGSYRSEFRYGSFSRDLRLPRGVDSKAVEAQYKDGILEVRLPWPKESATKPEKVSVSRG